MQSTLDVTTPCVSFSTASFFAYEGRSSQEGSHAIYLHAEASCPLAITCFSHFRSDLGLSLPCLLSSPYRHWMHCTSHPTTCMVTGTSPLNGCILYWHSVSTLGILVGQSFGRESALYFAGITRFIECIQIEPVLIHLRRRRSTLGCQLYLEIAMRTASTTRSVIHDALYVVA